MADYYVEFKGLMDQAAALQSISKALSSLEERFNRVVNAMDSRDVATALIKTRVLASAKSAYRLAEKLNASGSALTKIAVVYRNAEEKNTKALSAYAPTKSTDRASASAFSRLFAGAAGFQSSSFAALIAAFGFSESFQLFFDFLFMADGAALSSIGYEHAAELNSFLQGIKNNVKQSMDYWYWIIGGKMPKGIKGEFRLMSYVDCIYAIEKAWRTGELEDLASALLKTGKTVIKSANEVLPEMLPKLFEKVMARSSPVREAGSTIAINYIFNMTRNWIDSISSGQSVKETYWNTFANSALDTFSDTVLNAPTLIIAYIPASIIARTMGMDMMGEYERLTGETGIKAVTTGVGKLFSTIRENSTRENWDSGMKIIGEKISEGWKRLWNR